MVGFYVHFLLVYFDVEDILLLIICHSQEYISLGLRGGKEEPVPIGFDFFEIGHISEKGDTFFNHVLGVGVHNFNQNSFLHFVLDCWHLQNLFCPVLERAFVLSYGVELRLEDEECALALLTFAVEFYVELLYWSVENA